VIVWVCTGPYFLLLLLNNCWLQNLAKEDDVRKFVVSREAIRKKGGKPFTKRPKIQRLVTPVTVQRKRHLYVRGHASHRRGHALPFCAPPASWPAVFCVHVWRGCQVQRGGAHRCFSCCLVVISRAHVKVVAREKAQAEKAEYARLHAQRLKERKDSKRHSSRRSSRKEE
jgi:hypothetical protein